MPAFPTYSTNVCNDKTLYKNGVPPDGVSWYWQGVNSSGQDQTTSAAIAATYTASLPGNNTYYLSAVSSAGCWNSTAASVSVTVDKPSPPNPNTFSFCEWDYKVLTTTGIVNNLNWYNSLDQLLYTGPTYTPANVNVGNYVYKVKNVSSGGCESVAYANITLNVLNNCDQFINWNGTTNFKTDEAGTLVQAGANRNYYDGFGNSLQSQAQALTSNQVLATQNVSDARGKASLVTLPAPINSSSFAYRYRFITSPSNERYSAADFDLRVNNNSSGEVNNPTPVNNNGVGSLGWYYSTSNTMEPQTPISQFPYARNFIPEGPNPISSKQAIAGDQFRMGLNHEVVNDRQIFPVTELSHYIQIRSHFVNDNNSAEVIYSSSCDNTLGFIPNQNVSMSTVAQSGETYVKCITNQATSTPGLYPIGGVIPVTPSQTYKLRVRGFQSASNVYLLVKYGTTDTNLVWRGPPLPSGAINEAWVEAPFTVPAGVTSVRLGVLWSGTLAIGQFFQVNAIELVKTSGTSSIVAGYKNVHTDANGKKIVQYSDADGKPLASATLTGATYDDWSYSFYNDIGQIVASVSPNGVNTAISTFPTFVTTYKYDHRGRLIETKSPDEGTTKFTYDFDGRIKFSENQQQRDATPHKKFSYSNYDQLGRMIESGEYTCSGTNPYVFESHNTTNIAPYSVLNIAENKIRDIEAIGSFVGISRKLDATRCTDYTFVKYDAQALDFITDPNHPAQLNLTGQVSKTENLNSVTWYSYDEFGNSAWSKQNIVGFSAKTIDYKYDFLGMPLEIAYQKGQGADAFYHHYVYDPDQRLKEVWTSKDGINKTIRAKYYYYLHGPVKRVELLNGLTAVQGMDYVYTINNELKSINNADPARDPAMDGQAGSTFPKDVFGLTEHYYDNDYQGAAHNAGAQVINGYSNQYNGIPKAISWNSPMDNNVPRTYAFTYDKKYQLNEAKFGKYISGGFTPDAFDSHKESVPSYDKNGNISSLVRRGSTNNVLGNYNYVYETNTNRLDKVNNNGSLFIDYTYNPIGQMTQQVEGSNTLNVTYNAWGKVKDVKNASSQLMAAFSYDDRGNRISKTTYSAGVASNKTTYVADVSGNVLATYGQMLPGGAIQLLEVPIYGSGRIALYKPLVNTYFYEVDDHLGNVRAVIGLPDTDVYLATMEAGTVEEPPFKNISARRETHVGANHTPGGSAIVRMNNTRPDGPTINMPVSPGDKIDIEAWAYYESGSGYSNTIVQSTVLTAVALAFGGVAGAPGEAGQIFNRINSGITNMGLGSGGTPTLPAAYLQYIVYDKNYNYLYGGFQRVTASGNLAKEKIVQPQILIDQPGYIYIFLYNRSDSPNWVYFDDFKVTQQHSTIVAGADYYPFGLVMENREVTTEPYRYGMQGQFSEKDLTTGMQEFELRLYDARIGRWTSADPVRGAFNSPYIGMANQPNIRTDPDGGCPPPCLYFLLDAVDIVAKSEVATSISTAALRGVSIVGWYAQDMGKYFTSEHFLNDARRLLSGSTVLAASINKGWSGTNFGFDGGEDDTALKLGQGAAMLTSLYTIGGGTYTPGGSPVLVTPNLSVPVTFPVPVSTINAARVHNLNMNGGSSSDPFEAQLERQLAKDGPNSIRKSLKSFQQKLATHKGKVDSLQYKSSVEREIRTFETSIGKILEFMDKHGISLD
ncbi:MAG: RHS repeat-associated core domain-containing protein [Chryseolinea sp.]